LQTNTQANTTLKNNQRTISPPATHETKINVGGVIVSIPVFVVEDTTMDLILKKPWSRYVRAQ
jgi:hypothetical protein